MGFEMGTEIEEVLAVKGDSKQEQLLGNGKPCSRNLFVVGNPSLSDSSCWGLEQKRKVMHFTSYHPATPALGPAHTTPIATLLE